MGDEIHGSTLCVFALHHHFYNRRDQTTANVLQNQSLIRARNNFIQPSSLYIVYQVKFSHLQNRFPQHCNIFQSLITFDKWEIDMLKVKELNLTHTALCVSGELYCTAAEYSSMSQRLFYLDFRQAENTEAAYSYISVSFSLQYMIWHQKQHL